MSPLDRKDKDLLINAGLGAMHGLGTGSVVTNQRAGNHAAIGQGLRTDGEGRSLERNPSVLSRKELIKQEYNLLLETRLPKIMQLMNSEKSLGLGLGYGASNNERGDGNVVDTPEMNKQLLDDPKINIGSRGNNPNAKHRMHSSNLNKHFGKQSVDYDDTDFLQKMFSNENELRGLNKGSVHQTSLNTL